MKSKSLKDKLAAHLRLHFVGVSSKPEFVRLDNYADDLAEFFEDVCEAGGMSATIHAARGVEDRLRKRPDHTLSGEEHIRREMAQEVQLFFKMPV